MRKSTLGWKSLVACCVAGLVAWYFVSMLMFHFGWERLDPLCRDSPYSSNVYAIDVRYTAEAASRMKDVIASQFNEDAVFVDGEGVIYIRPAVYYGYYDELHRFAQLVVRPEDKPHLYQTRRITCDELRPLIRSTIDTVERTANRWSFSFYVIVLQPDLPTFERWQVRYKD